MQTLRYLQSKLSEVDDIYTHTKPVAKRNSILGNSDRTEDTLITNYVDFDNQVYVVDTISRHDYTPQEVEDCWFTPGEVLETEKEIYKQIQMMEEGKILKDKRYSSRGLEKFTKLKQMVRAENMIKGIDAVLDEQQSQLMSGNFDDERVARVYSRVSSSCQMWAQVVGLQDQRDAENYLDEDATESQNMISKKTKVRTRKNAVSARSA
jgi:hypothetical protein